MSFGSALVLIVAMGCLLKAYQIKNGITKDWLGNEKRAARDDDGIIAAQQKEITELRERVQILERIATDANSLEANKSKTIAKEIEELRD